MGVFSEVVMAGCITTTRAPTLNSKVWIQNSNEEGSSIKAYARQRNQGWVIRRERKQYHSLIGQKICISVGGLVKTAL